MENILIIEDEPETISILEEILSKKDYVVRTAINFNFALKSVNHVLPDLILMDIAMPGIDGFEACRQIKNDKKLKNIPIIFLTGKSSLSHKVKAFKAGAVDYITKPFASEEVIARIKTHLRIQQERKRYYALADATSEGIIIHKQGIIVEVNSAIETILNVKRKRIIGKNLSNIFSKKTVQIFLNNKELSFEIKEDLSNVRQVILYVQMKPINYMGKDINMIAIQDIS
ncbi:response regulator receiver sensor signal transduction histidine kinase, partial [Candidatus Magnetomorum sp. HK-1]